MGTPTAALSRDGILDAVSPRAMAGDRHGMPHPSSEMSTGEKPREGEWGNSGIAAMCNEDRTAALEAENRALKIQMDRLQAENENLKEMLHTETVLKERYLAECQYY